MSQAEPSGPDLGGVVADAEVGTQHALIAGLRSIVGFKRLAGRPQDRRDLEELEAFHGELPIEPTPGVDE